MSMDVHVASPTHHLLMLPRFGAGDATPTGAQRMLGCIRKCVVVPLHG